MKRILFVLLATCMCAQSIAAASFTNAHVESIRIDNDGRAIIFFDQSATGTPAGCSGYPNALAINSTTAGGKSILALVLSAKATGASLNVTGSGACATYGASVEDWSTGIMS